MSKGGGVTESEVQVFRNQLKVKKKKKNPVFIPSRRVGENRARRMLWHFLLLFLFDPLSYSEKSEERKRRREKRERKGERGAFFIVVRTTSRKSGRRGSVMSSSTWHQGGRVGERGKRIWKRESRVVGHIAAGSGGRWSVAWSNTDFPGKSESKNELCFFFFSRADLQREPRPSSAPC